MLRISLVLSLWLSTAAFGQTSVDMSKLDGFAVLQGQDERLSKAVGFAVLERADAELSKAVGFAVLYRAAESASKVVGFAVLAPPSP